jgi:hypothetical protein
MKSSPTASHVEMEPVQCSSCEDASYQLFILLNVISSQAGDSQITLSRRISHVPVEEKHAGFGRRAYPRFTCFVDVFSILCDVWLDISRKYCSDSLQTKLVYFSL